MHPDEQDPPTSGYWVEASFVSGAHVFQGPYPTTMAAWQALDQVCFRFPPQGVYVEAAIWDYESEDLGPLERCLVALRSGASISHEDTW